MEVVFGKEVLDNVGYVCHASIRIPVNLCERTGLHVELLILLRCSFHSTLLHYFWESLKKAFFRTLGQDVKTIK